MATEHSHTTIDHDEIRQWAEEKGGRPATVKNTERGGEHAGILRINFPGSSADDSLEDIDWDTGTPSSISSRSLGWHSCTRTRPPKARKADSGSSSDDNARC